MANLGDAERGGVRDRMMSDPEIAAEMFGNMTKADLRAAVDALDAYLEANKAAINSAIPQPARGQMTTKQKARLLVLVVERRYLTGN